MLLAGKRYRYDKYISVFFITLGIFICTLISANKKEDNQDADGGNESLSKYGMMMGILLLCYALVVSSVMGLIQEYTYKRFGKHPEEALFIDHVLGLPFFYFFGDQVSDSFGKLLASAPATLPVANVQTSIPTGIFFLLTNILTSYGCIKSVFILTTECTSLTVTLVITVRKFLTLMVSVFYFGNDFTLFHWLGTSFVFCGALVYADIISLDKILGRKVEATDQKKDK